MYDTKFKVGDRVRHKTLGIGTVSHVDSRGPYVFFPEGHQVWCDWADCLLVELGRAAAPVKHSDPPKPEVPIETFTAKVGSFEWAVIYHILDRGPLQYRTGTSWHDLRSPGTPTDVCEDAVEWRVSPPQVPPTIEECLDLIERLRRVTTMETYVDREEAARLLTRAGRLPAKEEK